MFKDLMDQECQPGASSQGTLTATVQTRPGPSEKLLLNGLAPLIFGRSYRLVFTNHRAVESLDKSLLGTAPVATATFVMVAVIYKATDWKASPAMQRTAYRRFLRVSSKGHAAVAYGGADRARGQAARSFPNISPLTEGYLEASQYESKIRSMVAHKLARRLTMLRLLVRTLRMALADRPEMLRSIDLIDLQIAELSRLVEGCSLRRDT
ncbi:hypothetical protein SB861_46330 [Paraburkholderia sp. SIMBA_049]